MTGPVPLLHPSLFDDVNPDDDLAGMVHTADPHTSVDAATKMAHRRTALHARVLEAFDRHGPMTDDELERLPEFAGYGPSTIRKRRSELYQQQALRVCGEGVNRRGCKMLRWEIV